MHQSWKSPILILSIRNPIFSIADITGFVQPNVIIRWLPIVKSCSARCITSVIFGSFDLPKSHILTQGRCDVSWSTKEIPVFFLTTLWLICYK